MPLYYFTALIIFFVAICQHRIFLSETTHKLLYLFVVQNETTTVFQFSSEPALRVSSLPWAPGLRGPPSLPIELRRNAIICYTNISI